MLITVCLTLAFISTFSNSHLSRQQSFVLSSEAARQSNSPIFKVWNEPSSQRQPPCSAHHQLAASTGNVPLLHSVDSHILKLSFFFLSIQPYPVQFSADPWWLDSWQADYKAGLSEHCVSRALSEARASVAAGSTNCSFAAVTFSTGQRLGSGSALMSLFFNYSALAGREAPSGTEYSSV